MNSKIEFFRTRAPNFSAISIIGIKFPSSIFFDKNLSQMLASSVCIYLSATSYKSKASGTVNSTLFWYKNLRRARSKKLFPLKAWNEDTLKSIQLDIRDLKSRRIRFFHSAWAVRFLLVLTKILLANRLAKYLHLADNTSLCAGISWPSMKKRTSENCSEPNRDPV